MMTNHGNHVQYTRARTARAFTLVELLVVIGIIAILISFLLPVLNKARDTANTARCLSSLRQLNQYVVLYSGDYKGYVPIAKDSRTGGATWEDLILPYIDRSYRGVPLPMNMGLVTGNAHNVLWGCPVWNEIWQRSSGATALLGTDPARACGYGMNIFPKAPNDYGGFNGLPTAGTATAPGAINWYDDTISRFGRFFKITDWKQPADRAMFGDCLPGPTMSVNPPAISGGSTTLDPRHGGHGEKQGRYVNITYWDGSASSVLIKEARYSCRMQYP